MASNNQQEVMIRLRCIALPGRAIHDRSAVRLGIQKGKEVVDDLWAEGDEVDFTCSLRVEKNNATGTPNFLGPYAQGTPKERFIYLCWGERKGGAWDGFGRVKVHLKDLAWPAIEKAMATGDAVEAIIKMVDQKGRPVFASLKKENITWAV
ncbi:MAG: hypothetical protein KDE50_36650 [Caldilineaceae bacterium]|nr:hypothetical protein [Caldilineaceae bacterium]